MTANPILVAPGVYAWLQGGALGEANAGVVIDSDGITVIDCLMVENQVEPFAKAVETFGCPIRRVVLNCSHIQYVGGSSHFWPASYYGTSATSDLLDLPPNVAGYRRLMPAFAETFAEDLTTQPISHIVDASAALTPAVHLVTAAGPTAANLMSLIPGAGVLFAGAVCVFGSVPLGFEADFVAWINALDYITELGASDLTIVPGQGPIGGPAEVAALRHYLEACLQAEGDLDRLADGPWARWQNQEFHAVNVERAAQNLQGTDAIPLTMLRLVGLAP